MNNSWDLICFSHLRWDFVFQRPQHLLTRCGRERRVLFVEEAMHDGPTSGQLSFHPAAPGVTVVVPHIPAGWNAARQNTVLQALLTSFVHKHHLKYYVSWYYTPMALGFTRGLCPQAIVYDCMDELSAFLGAPLSLIDHEVELMHRADVIFTGGQSLYEAKRDKHHNVHAFPSSIDFPHFAQARLAQPDPADQAAIPHPRLGFAGVIDERMDLPLLAGIAERRPDWHLVLLGPVVKIDPASLPSQPNIHYLGQKSYSDLPAYLAGWDVAMLPFAHNNATRFISPTKTPEYLAAGKPVVSTSIRDVVRPYGQMGLVQITDDVDGFVTAVERALHSPLAEKERRKKADAFLAHVSWDITWQGMRRCVDHAVTRREVELAG